MLEPWRWRMSLDLAGTNSGAWASAWKVGARPCERGATLQQGGHRPGSYGLVSDGLAGEEKFVILPLSILVVCYYVIPCLWLVGPSVSMICEPDGIPAKPTNHNGKIANVSRARQDCELVRRRGRGGTVAARSHEWLLRLCLTGGCPTLQGHNCSP